MLTIQGEGFDAYVLSDSTCDLSQELLDKYDISIIPLHIVKGEEELEDGTDIDISALYECLFFK